MEMVLLQVLVAQALLHQSQDLPLLAQAAVAVVELVELALVQLVLAVAVRDLHQVVDRLDQSILVAVAVAVRAALLVATAVLV
jgi:hypothetical protein